jgi:hypothetical protein
MKTIAYVVIAVALLCGLFLLFKPGPAKVPALTDGSPSSSSPPAPSPSEAPSQGGPIAGPGATVPERTDAGSTVDLVVAHGKLVSGPSVVRVKQNDVVVFHVTSDAADELHLHGYNLHLALKPATTATLEVRAARAGRFTYELHHLDLELGALEVYPR